MHASEIQNYSSGEGIDDLTPEQALFVLNHPTASNLPPDVRARLVHLSGVTPAAMPAPSASPVSQHVQAGGPS